MKRTKLVIAVIFLAALFALKAFFPNLSGGIINRAKEVLAGERAYRQVLSELSEDIGLFNEEGGTSAAPPTEDSFLAEPIPMQVEHAQSSSAELESESGKSEGEETVILPDSVAAFLESQEEYSEYEIPEKASYDYYIFKEAYTTPVEGMNSSGFGYRTHPIHGDIRFHYGTDYAAWTGEDIRAFADGIVSYAGYCESFGNYITVEHKDGWQSLYAHCSALYVEEGDAVSAGDKIALVGATGLVTGPHLHFELSKNGVYVNPEYYVN